MGLLIVLFASFICHGLGYDIFEEDKRQQLYPFPRVGRGSIWDLIEEKRLGGLMPFPRVGRTDGKRQGLIPFPRIGRSIDDYDGAQQDNDNIQDEGLYDVSHHVFKRAGKARFTPRIGRRKRSIHPDEEPQMMSTSASTTSASADNQESPWQVRSDPEFSDDSAIFFPSADRDYLAPGARMARVMFKQKRALTPRIGRSDRRLQRRAAVEARLDRSSQSTSR